MSVLLYLCDHGHTSCTGLCENETVLKSQKIVAESTIKS